MHLPLPSGISMKKKNACDGFVCLSEDIQFDTQDGRRETCWWSHLFFWRNKNKAEYTVQSDGSVQVLFQMGEDLSVAFDFTQPVSQKKKWWHCRSRCQPAPFQVDTDQVNPSLTCFDNDNS